MFVALYGFLFVSKRLGLFLCEIVTQYNFLVSKTHGLLPVRVIVTKYSFLLSTDHGLWSTACLGDCHKV